MKILLFLLCVAEVLLYTFCKNIAGEVFSPVLILIVSFSIAFLSLRLHNAPLRKQASTSRPKIWSIIAAITIFTGLSAWVLVIFINIFPAIPITNSDSSDVILTHLHLVKNFIAGKPAYEPFLNVNYVITPSYLPFQWMPYIIAEYFHFDYRWIAFAVFWLAALFFFIKNLSAVSHSGFFWRIVIPVWPLVIYATLVQSNLFEFLITLESLAAGYYLLLATAIDKRKWILMAIALAICILSRMGIVLWAPLCVACFFIYGERKKSFIIAGACLLFVLIFYCPFIISSPASFFNPYRSYSVPIEATWGRNSLRNGFSFNTWGMRFLNGDMHHKVTIYNNIHLFACTFSILALGLYFLRVRKKYTFNSYLLFSLKIYLTIFYTLIQLPFFYLFIVPLMITPALLSNAFITKRDS